MLPHGLQTLGGDGLPSALSLSHSSNRQGGVAPGQTEPFALAVPPVMRRRVWGDRARKSDLRYVLAAWQGDVVMQVAG